MESQFPRTPFQCHFAFVLLRVVLPRFHSWEPRLFFFVGLRLGGKYSRLFHPGGPRLSNKLVCMWKVGVCGFKSWTGCCRCKCFEEVLPCCHDASCGLIRQCLLHCQHGGLWSWTRHVRRELLQAVGLHPLPKWTHCTEAGSKKYINISQRNVVWPRACVTSRWRRTSRPGDPCPNLQGAGTDRPCLLLSIRVRTTN